MLLTLAIVLKPINISLKAPISATNQIHFKYGSHLILVTHIESHQRLICAIFPKIQETFCKYFLKFRKLFRFLSFILGKVVYLRVKTRVYEKRHNKITYSHQAE